MIVFVNAEEKNVTICDKTVKTYPFSMFSAIKNVISGKEVIYVSETLLTDGDSVIDLISEYIDEDNGLSDEGDEVYIRTTGKQKYSISYNGKNYLFQGMYDIKPISSFPAGFVENCKPIMNGIRDGLFEIITERQKFYLQQEKEEQEQKKQEEQEDNEDMKGSVDNPIDIDLSGTRSFKKKQK